MGQRGGMLLDGLTPEQHAMLGHLSELRRTVVESKNAQTQFEAAVLLIDLYEAILKIHGVLIYEDQEEIVKH
jgi:hypothetical protein